MDAVTGGPTAILVHTFPLHSTTFVANEVRELRRRGRALALFAVRAPRPADQPRGSEDLRAATRYVLPAGFGPLAAAQARAFARSPRGYLRGLRQALTLGRLSSRDRVRTLIHFAEAAAILPMLEESGCRHLHVHALSGVATIALLMRPLGGPPFSLTAHGTDIFVEKVLIAEKIAGALFTRVGTRFNRDYLVRTFGARADRIRVLPFGVDPARFRPREGPARGEGPVRLISVGRLVWQKAHDLLLRACARLRARGIDLRLTIVGDGEERPRLEAERNRLGLESVVDLTGAADEEAVARALAQADLFVLSSVSEGFGMVLLEAMSCGLPVVAPALNGLPEVVADGVEGLLFPPGSEEELAGRIAVLCADEGLRRRLGEAGRRRVLASCRLDARVAAFDHLLEVAAGEAF